MNPFSRTALGLSIAAALVAQSAQAAIFNVINANDAGPGSLRQALIDANANNEADTIELSSISGQTIELTNGPLVIQDDPILINGSGVTLDAGRRSRVIYAFDGRYFGNQIAINNLTITGGFATRQDPVPLDTDRVLSGFGAGILVLGMNIELDNVEIIGNEGFSGPGIYFASQFGSMVIENSIISGNKFCDNGALQVYASNYSDIEIRHTTISNNQFSNVLADYGHDCIAAGAGISVYVGNNSEVTIQGTTIENNSTPESGGGGVINLINDSILKMSESTVSNNSANVIGGLALSSNDSIIDISNTTISRNSAFASIGGIHFLSSNSTGSISFSTITDNVAGAEAGGFNFSSFIGDASLEFNANILAGNSAPLNPELNISLGDSSGDSLIEIFNSLIGEVPESDSILLDSASQAMLGQDPQIGPLLNNGGPTKTHLPFTNSIVLDQMPFGTLGCGIEFSTDQRGQARPQKNACDLGSVEGSGDPPIPQAEAVPALDRWSLSLMTGLLALIGLIGLRHR